jgi:hypothetical protein
MLKYVFSILVSFTVLPIAIFSVQRFSSMPLGNTTIWWLIQVIVLLILLVARFVFFQRENRRHFLFLNLFLIWVIFSVVRGVYMAENYWDFKSLIERAFELFLPVVAYTASNKERLQSILSFFVKVVLPSSVLFLFAVPPGAWGWYLFPVGFLILFLPALKTPWKILLVVIALVALLGDISTRSHTFKYGIPILLLLIYYFRFFIATDQILNIGRLVFTIAPWVLLFLGVSGIFNVFKINEYIKTSYVAETTNAEGEIKKQDLTDDSRTFIYTEVLQSAKKHNYWILGRSPARGNDTVAFADFFQQITGKNERYKNEANVPNIFTWMGIIGLLLYFLVFYKAFTLAITKSNNIYIKIIGLFVAFRWAYAWAEDYAAFGTNDLTIWLMVGACLSESFRKMNNLEVKLWARGIMENRYVKYLNYINKDAPRIILKYN